MQEKEFVLEAKIREKKQRDQDGKLIPAVVYGKGFENMMVWVNFKNFNKLFKEAGESTIIKLAVEGKKTPQNVLVYEAQRDPVSGAIKHLDFYRVRMDEEIETDVELEFVGMPPAVKELGGIFVQNASEVEVKCLPGDLPASIVVDVSGLKTFEDYIYAKDLKVGDKVQVLLDPETVIALVSAPRSEKDLEDLDAEVESDISKVEGIEKKEEEKEEEGQSPKPAGEKAKKE